MKVICRQDECAPDSFSYFKEDLKEFSGLNFNEFIQQSGKQINDTESRYILKIKGKKYHLVICAEDPWYSLYEEDSQG